MSGPTFVDTHCHIHSEDYPADATAVLAAAAQAGVDKLICVGTDVDDSERAATFVAQHEKTWGSAGIHPHESSRFVGKKIELERFKHIATQPKMVAIGECGLDYYYTHSPKNDQIAILHFQIETALEMELPLIFHVRDAFKDFWPIFDSYPGLAGVIHSFTADMHDLDEILARGLYVGLNGITTFMKPGPQLEAVKAVPLEKMVLETDAPFLTPIPFRGTMNESKYVPLIAAYIADLRGEAIPAIASATTANATKLFTLE